MSQGRAYNKPVDAVKGACAYVHIERTCFRRPRAYAHRMNPGHVLDGTTLEVRNLPRCQAKLGIGALLSRLPAGGLTGQSLTKVSNADFDVDWTTISGGGAGLTNLDGGHSNTVYGGTTGVDGGGA